MAGSKGGRPSSYSIKKADIICERLALGRSLLSICSDEDVPSYTTILRWLSQHEEFRVRYARARETQADALFDEILEIADHKSLDTIKGRNGEDVFDHEWAARSKLRIEARKWMAGKLKPKVYGDKIELEHSGDIGLRPIVMGERPEE